MSEAKLRIGAALYHAAAYGKIDCDVVDGALLAIEGECRELDRDTEGRERALAEAHTEIARLREELEAQRDRFAEKSVRFRDQLADKRSQDVAEVMIGEGFDPHGFFVYFLWGDDPGVPLYVGRSENVLGRLGQHLGESRKRRHIRRVALVRCTSEAEMNRVEADLIRSYSPPWNVLGVVRRAPGGELLRSAT